MEKTGGLISLPPSQENRAPPGRRDAVVLLFTGFRRLEAGLLSAV